MYSKLEEIYFDTQAVTENAGKNERYKKAFKEYDKFHNELESGLNEEQKKLLDELFVASGGMESAYGLFAYKEGFKAALLIAIETLL